MFSSSNPRMVNDDMFTGDQQDPDVEVHMFPFGGGNLTSEEVASWQRWFRQHGIKLGEGNTVLIWVGNLLANKRGYVERDVRRRRIYWHNAATGKRTFFQLESPPLPFPTVIGELANTTGTFDNYSRRGFDD